MRKERSVKELKSLHSPNAEQNTNSDTTTSLDNNQVESYEYSTSMLSNAHANFGNDIVQSSLAGGDSHLESVIHSSIVSDISGIGHASRDTGNGEVQQVMRAQLRGRNPEESFPDASDPRIQRIKESGGSPLPTVLREKLESEFGHNFQHVRIHNSGLDAESAQAIHAHAFTVGSHIFFNRGTYNPASRGGMELLAHELTHVVQFDEGRIRSSSGEMEVSSPTDAVEVEAVQKGAEVARAISYSSSETLSSTNHIEGSTQASLETAFDAGHTETATLTEESAQKETPQASDTLLRKPDGDKNKGKGGGNSEVIQIFAQEIKQGGRAKAEEMYRNAPPAERDIVEKAIRQVLGDTIASEIATENESGGGGAAVPKVESKKPPEAPQPIDQEKNATPSKKKGSGGDSTTTTAPAPQTTPSENTKNAEGADLNTLSIDDLDLIHQEIVEHQSWSGAQARVGQAGSVDRAAFIAEKAGEGAISGAIDGGVQGLVAGGVGKLAARFIPIPGVGPIISGSMSAYGLIKGWDQSMETIGKMGEGDSEYEVIANTIASISGIIDLVCNIMNVFAGILGVISAVMWIVSIVTVGAASPLAASLTAIASGISVVTGVLDALNNMILQPCVLLFRALHTFKSEADPRSVEAGGAGIAEASSKITGFLGGYVGGKLGEAGGGKLADGVDSMRGTPAPSTSGGNGPTQSADGPTQTPDGPTQSPDAAPSQAPEGPTQSADGPTQTPDAPAQAADGPSSAPAEGSAQAPDTRTPAAETPQLDIQTPRQQPTETPTTAPEAPSQSPDGPSRTPEAPRAQSADGPTQAPDGPDTQRTSGQDPAEIEADIQETRRSVDEVIKDSRQNYIETKERVSQERRQRIDDARTTAQQQAQAKIEADRQSRYQEIDAQQQSKQQHLESGRGQMHERVNTEARNRYDADVEAAKSIRDNTVQTANKELMQRTIEAETGRSERQALIDREYMDRNLGEIDARRQERQILDNITDPKSRLEREAQFNQERTARQKSWEQEYNQRTQANEQQLRGELDIAKSRSAEMKSQAERTHSQSVTDARNQRQQRIEQAHRELDAKIEQNQSDAYNQKSQVDAEMEGRSGEVDQAGNTAENDTRASIRQEGRNALKEGMRQEREKYVTDERESKFSLMPQMPKLPKLPEGENRWHIFGNENTPTTGNVVKGNEGIGAGAKTLTAEMMKPEAAGKPAGLEKEASTRQVAPQYEEPPGSPDQLDALVKQIDQILATRAQASQTEQKMGAEQDKHKSNKTQIDGLTKETASAMSAQEAHQQAVARTQEANRGQQQRQKESQARMDGYAERMAGVAAIKGPLKIFQGFSWIGSKLPGSAGRAMSRMNADANKMNEAFGQMDAQMEAQAQGQEGHQAALNEDSERLNAVATQGQESSKNLDTASKGAEGLSQANQGKIKESTDAKNQSKEQGAQLDQAAETKKSEHQSLKDRLVTWARGHKEARLTAQNASKEKKKEAK